MRARGFVVGGAKQFIITQDEFNNKRGIGPRVLVDVRVASHVFNYYLRRNYTTRPWQKVVVLVALGQQWRSNCVLQIPRRNKTPMIVCAADHSARFVVAGCR